MPSLNVRRVGDDDWPRHIKMLLVGNTGAGKTRMSSTAPNVLYLNAEGGMMSVRDRQPAVIDITTVSALLEAKMALDQEPSVREQLIGFPVQTVVVDTIDEVSRILMRERVESQKKESPAIADWGWLGDQMRGILRGFRNLDLNLILCCHVRSSEDSESGRTVYNPAIQGAMGEEIAGYVDLAVLLRARRRTRLVDGQAVEEMVRFLQCAPDLQHGWIKDRSGKLPAEFEVNLDDDFKRLDALIYGDPAEELRQIATDLAKDKDPPAKRRTKTKVEEPLKGTVVDEPDAPAEVAEPEAPEPASKPAPPPKAQEPEVSVPEPKAAAQTEDGPPWVCADCETVFSDRDQADISFIRYRRRLCNACFRAAKLNKAR